MGLEYQKDGWKAFPLFGRGVAGLTVCCFGIGAVFEKTEKLKKSFGPHVVVFLHMFLVGGKVVWFFLEMLAGISLAFI